MTSQHEPGVKPKVVIAYDTFPDLSIEQTILAALNAEIVQMHPFTVNEGWDAAAEADALMVTIQKVPAELLARMMHCKIVCRVGTGLDAIDIPAATARQIWVANVPDYSVDEVSSHAVALVLAHARQLPRMFDLVQRRVWYDPTQIDPIRRLAGQTLGLLGYGRNGRAVALKARAFGLNIIAHDPFIPPEVLAADDVKAVDFDILLRDSDYLSLHSPLTDATRHVINAARLAQMKPTAFLINTARGPLIDEAALLDAVRARRIAGAALDVLSTEPPAPDSPLLSEPRIWITPHVAWYSEEAKVDVRRKGAEEVARVLKGENPRAPVNQINR